MGKGREGEGEGDTYHVSRITYHVSQKNRAATPQLFEKCILHFIWASITTENMHPRTVMLVSTLLNVAAKRGFIFF